MIQSTEALSTPVHAAESAHRIGAVSRLAGVPVATLRVWESRYGAFTPAKSAGSHRLYGDSDLMRAQLLRQLTDSGHSIGSIARRPSGELQQLLERAHEIAKAKAPIAGRPITVLLIGPGLAGRLEAQGFDEQLGAKVRIGQVFPGLKAAQTYVVPAASETPADSGEIVVLLARLNAVNEESHQQLLRVWSQSGAQGAIVFYRYAAPQVLDAMRSAGVLLRREPVAASDFAQLLRSMAYPEVRAPVAASGGLIPPRRYSDEALAKVAESTTDILCECPLHLAELIGQLASFEEYSQNCLNDNPEDARVHAHLRIVSGAARAMFENALDLTLAHARKKV